MDKKSGINDGIYATENKNYAILVSADKLGWRAATKTKGMIARKLVSDCTVQSLEGPLDAKAGHFVCRGINTDDWWVQKEEAINTKYSCEGVFKSAVLFNGQEYHDFRLYMPKPDKAVLACQIPEEFTVHASWGKLQGKKGDFLIKPIEDKLSLNPQDVWLVAQGLFQATYECK